MGCAAVMRLDWQASPLGARSIATSHESEATVVCLVIVTFFFLGRMIHNEEDVSSRAGKKLNIGKEIKHKRKYLNI